MAIATSYYSASGPAYDRCGFLAQRYDADGGYKPGEGECWICTAVPGKDDEAVLTAHRGTTAWLTQLWRSPSGAVYVSSASGAVHMNRDPADRASKWQVPKIDAALFGIWGLDDEFVLTWGTRDQVPAMFRWDGRTWTEMPAPGFGVRAVHGVAQDLVYAVGLGGGVARWDGGAWRSMRTPTREILASVFVVDADEVYAVGNRGAVLEGSAAGWGKIGDGPGLPGPLAAVAVFQGKLWIGAWTLGLFRRAARSNRFEPLKPNLHAVHLDVRGSLVISCDDMIAGTDDGNDFFATGDGWLAALRAGHALCDF